MEFQGEIAALSAAVVWALATWIYSQFSHHFSAMQLNIVKGVGASGMMLVVMPWIEMPTMAISATHLAILAVSGIIGIAVGDSAYFASLKRIGANKTLLLESLAPPLSGVLALVALGSVLPLQSWLGVLLTTLAVTFVIFQPDASGEQTKWSGVGFGLLASVCQASGVVISHYALVAGDLPPLLGALIRLSVGVLAVAMVIVLFEQKPFSSMRKHLGQLTKSAFLWLLGAIFVGTFLALWLQQIALKHANPAIAQTLIATSPLFILFIYMLKGEKVTAKSIIGTLAAVGGISLFFWR
ncbi:MULTISPECIES: DMT family transporter [Vibrio]|uniref:DMT family transporter n=1 Tax=Vibrio TaxID=662 RepID=UPI0001B93BCA|nr:MULTISPECIES: DMT family transporter [Vibrio]EEX32926.1 permease [Vibrio coralliilyticus ATCC BAA-450]MCM5507569.1 DMT family transporter [Vibrio sp. SCSIO 43169]MDE3899545.1 DMT family transporter [Vibrio sp. CC007]QFT38772.1 EamA-like transporter family protein [Vibrio sp. THAF64]QGM36690.1 EamA-like transporter family protein [Vibrio sp. THAF191d]